MRAGRMGLERREPSQLVDKLQPAPERPPAAVRVLERAANRVGARRELDHDAGIGPHRHAAMVGSPSWEDNGCPHPVFCHKARVVWLSASELAA